MAALVMPNPNDGLPSSIQTEVTVLGAMLLDAVAITDATDQPAQTNNGPGSTVSQGTGGLY